MARQFQYDYYEINLPGDLFDSSDTEAFASQAIDEARERAKLYCIPATWTATLIRGTLGESFEVTYKVCRKRSRRAA